CSGRTFDGPQPNLPSVGFNSAGTVNVVASVMRPPYKVRSLMPPPVVDTTGNRGLRVVRGPGEHERGEVEVGRSAVGVAADSQRLPRVVTVQPDPRVAPERAEPGRPSGALGRAEIQGVTAPHPQVERRRAPVPQPGQRE